MDDSERTKLQDKIRSLESEVVKYKARINQLESHRPYRAGRTGEEYLASLLGVEATITNSQYDILTLTNCRLEVKTSKLNSYKHAEGGHWAWSKPLGGDSDKDYDRLILLAEPDSRHSEHYLQPIIRYVIFDIPFSDVPKLLNLRRDVSCGTNPRRTFSDVARLLYKRFQITESEFVRRYQSKSA